MSVKLSDEKTDLIKKIAKSEGYEDYELDVTSGSIKGDNYLGTINTVDIEDRTNNKKSLNLIIKSALVEETLRQNSPIRKAYERETYVYETVFVEFQKLFDELGVKNRFTQRVRCYGTLLVDGQECIVLENLKRKNFAMWNRKVGMDEEHVAIVFSAYAKLHASGLILKHFKPEKFGEMSKNLVNIFVNEDDVGETKKKFEQSSRHAIENGFRAVANNPKATEAFSRFAQDCLKLFGEEMTKRDKFTTILHGDCWCNNMLFQYEDVKNPSKPTTMCLIDWQIAQLGSLINDLSYFFYSSSSKEVLYKIKKFLKVYHESFSKVVESVGLNPDDILTYEELEEQWKKWSRFGLLMALFAMKIVLGETEDAPDLSELARAGQDMLQALTTAPSSNMEAINERISNVIVFMVEHDYL